MIVAVDTGGTKTLITSFDKKGRINTRQTKFPTPQNQNKYLQLLIGTLTEIYSNQKIDAIVIAVPSILRDGVVIATSNLPWKNLDIKSALSKVFKDVPILIENDAKLAGLGETRQLRKIPPQSLYVTISTGIGSGIITNGYIDTALNHSEAGQMMINYDGKDQKWENFASGRAIHGLYGYARDIKSKHAWNDIAFRMSRGFLTIIPTLQPDIIIIGGSIGTYFKRYSRPLKKAIKNELPKIIKMPKIVRAKHPELAVIYGCYYYAIDEIISKTA